MPDQQWSGTNLAQISLLAGAKLVYGRLCRYAGRDGVVYPAMHTLAVELGLGKTQSRTYVQELEREKFVAVDRQNRHFAPDGAGGSNRYVFLWHRAFDGEIGNPRKRPPLRETGRVTPTVNRAERESSSRESVEDSQSCRAAERVPRNRRPDPAEKTKVSKIYDDEKPKITGLPNKALEEEFLRRIEERHDTRVDAKQCLNDVKQELRRSGNSLTEYLSLDLMATTAPDRLTNPHGYYRDLGRKLGRKRSAEVIEGLLETQRRALEFLETHKPQPNEVVQKCAVCQQAKGRGVFIENGELAPCPECATPEWAAQVKRTNIRDKAMAFRREQREVSYLEESGRRRTAFQDYSEPCSGKPEKDSAVIGNANSARKPNSFRPIPEWRSA